MKEIKLSKETIKLDIGDELRVKDLRKIQPIIAKQEQGKEIDMVIDIIKELSPQENVEEIIDNLNMEDFTKLSQETTKLIDTKKKMSQ